MNIQNNESVPSNKYQCQLAAIINSCKNPVGKQCSRCCAFCEKPCDNICYKVVYAYDECPYVQKFKKKKSNAK